MIERLPAYDGAVAARIYQILEGDKPQQPQYVPGGGQAVEVDSSAASLKSNPALAGLVEVVEV